MATQAKQGVPLNCATCGTRRVFDMPLAGPAPRCGTCDLRASEAKEGMRVSLATLRGTPPGTDEEAWVLSTFVRAAKEYARYRDQPASTAASDTSTPQVAVTTGDIRALADRCEAPQQAIPPCRGCAAPDPLSPTASLTHRPVTSADSLCESCGYAFLDQLRDTRREELTRLLPGDEDPSWVIEAIDAWVIQGAPGSDTARVRQQRFFSGLAEQLVSRPALKGRPSRDGKSEPLTVARWGIEQEDRDTGEALRGIGVWLRTGDVAASERIVSQSEASQEAARAAELALESEAVTMLRRGVSTIEFSTWMRDSYAQRLNALRPSGVVRHCSECAARYAPNSSKDEYCSKRCSNRIADRKRKRAALPNAASTNHFDTCDACQHGAACDVLEGLLALPSNSTDAQSHAHPDLDPDTLSSGLWAPETADEELENEEEEDDSAVG